MPEGQRETANIDSTAGPATGHATGPAGAAADGLPPVFGAPTADTDDQRRRYRMAVLAQADANDLKNCWRRLDIDPAFRMLRGPETGLVTVRGRMGGTGRPFNFGDTTVTRATVRMESGAIGHACRMGRDRTAARLAAVIDALADDRATDSGLADRVEHDVIAPLATAIAERDRRRNSETAATRVEFFTMVRGDD